MHSKISSYFLSFFHNTFKNLSIAALLKHIRAYMYVQSLKAMDKAKESRILKFTHAIFNAYIRNAGL